MLIANDTNLVEFHNWFFRIREPSNKLSNRIPLMLHGWSGDENSMWVFAKDIPKDYWVISPRAPFSAGEKGYSWRNATRESSWNLPKIFEFQPTMEKLLELLETWANSNSVYYKTIDMVGFSQGAALVCALVLSSPSKFEKVACLAGFMPDGGSDIAKPGLLFGRKIFVSHGIGDEIIPLSRGQEMVKILKYSGAEVFLCEEEVGHKVGIQCYKGLQNFFIKKT